MFGAASAQVALAGLARLAGRFWRLHGTAAIRLFPFAIALTLEVAESSYEAPITRRERRRCTPDRDGFRVAEWCAPRDRKRGHRKQNRRRQRRCFADATFRWFARCRDNGA